ncbi:hypothetical protein Tco_0711446 [Tanacetum coccineum]
MKSQQTTNAFVKETFMDLKTQLETVAKNHQASIQNLETKFDGLADKQSGRPSGSLPSSTQPNPKGHNSKTYQPPQSRNEHVNAVSTRSAKLSLETLEPTKMSVRLADRSFQYPVGIAENMLVEVVVRVKQKQLNLGVGTKQMIFNIDSAMKHSYSNDDTCFSIDVIDEILEEDFDALLNEGSKILHSIKGTLLEKEIFAEFDEFMAMTANENSDSDLIPKNNHSRKSPSIQIIKSEHLSKNLLHISNLNLFLIIWNMYSWKNILFFPLSYHLSFPKRRKTNLYSSLKSISKLLLGKRQIFLVSITTSG